MKNIIKYLFIFVSLCTICTACSDDDETTNNKYPVPVVTDFSPKTGLPTTEITIKGSNFGSERYDRIGRVYFGGVEATDYVSYSDDQIVVKVPEDAVTGPVTVWVWKNNTETSEEFTFIPGAKIQTIQPANGVPGETVTIMGGNFQDIEISKIKVDFNGTLGTVTSATNTTIEVVVPEGAKTGPVTLTFEGLQTVVGPSFTVGSVHVDDIVFNLWEYIKSEGTIKIAGSPENYIDGTNSGAYVMYEFTVPVSAKYEVSLMASTNQTYAVYVNADLGTSTVLLSEKVLDNSLTQQITKQGWGTFEQHNYGPFILKKGTTYYLRASFLADGTSWVANVNDIRIKLAEDQNAPAIDVDGSSEPAYRIYQNDFNSGTSLLPFTPRWAESPNYAKVENQYLEFYFNQAALDANPDRRMLKGAEVVCDFATNTEGWYGFKIFLPEGKFPKNIDGSIIAQIFNSGDGNSWAGHLTIDKNELTVSHRHALIDPVKGTVGTLTWDKWIPIIVHFKVGRVNTGRVRVWMGDQMKENEPAYDAQNIRFGFGDWIDDNTLNNKVSESNPVADYIGCKFGLYVATGGDRIIRFDDLKALEGNPDGAFEIVKPGN